MIDKTDEFYLERLMWEDGIWAKQIAPDFEFIEGKRYLRMDGKPVTIIRGRYDGAKGYECVQGDDGADSPNCGTSYTTYDENGDSVENICTAEELGFRYNRTTTQSDLGRCTGSRWDDPRNLIPIYFPFLNE